MAKTVMNCMCGYVKPGHNRPLLSIIEWARREATERGWEVYYKAYTAADGRQAVNAYLIADI